MKGVKYVQTAPARFFVLNETFSNRDENMFTVPGTILDIVPPHSGLPFMTGEQIYYLDVQFLAFSTVFVTARYPVNDSNRKDRHVADRQPVCDEGRTLKSLLSYTLEQGISSP